MIYHVNKYLTLLNYQGSACISEAVTVLRIVAKIQEKHQRWGLFLVNHRPTTYSFDTK